MRRDPKQADCQASKGDRQMCPPMAGCEGCRWQAEVEEPLITQRPGNACEQQVRAGIAVDVWAGQEAECEPTADLACEQGKRDVELSLRADKNNGSCRVPGCWLAGAWLAVPTSF